MEMCVPHLGSLICSALASTYTGDSLISDGRLRGELSNDLLELEAFLRQRRIELSDEDNVAFVGQYEGTHAALQQQSTATVGKSSSSHAFPLEMCDSYFFSFSLAVFRLYCHHMYKTDRYLDGVMTALRRLRSKRLQQLIMIRTSSAFVDRLVRGLKQRLEHIAKLKKAIVETEARRDETMMALVSTFSAMICHSLLLFYQLVVQLLCQCCCSFPTSYGFDLSMDANVLLLYIVQTGESSS